MTTAAAADADAPNENDTTVTTTETTPIPILTNRLFLSSIDYKNYDDGNGDGADNDLSPEIVKERLEEMFSKFGLVQEIFLSEKEDTSKDKEQQDGRPAFGFIAMETPQQAQTALRALNDASHSQQNRLFKDVAPAKIHKSKNNKQNKNERLRSERLAEYRKRSLFITGTGSDRNNGLVAANVVCQVHTSHLERLRDFVLTMNTVSLIGSFSAQKGTSLLLLRVDDEKEGTNAVEDDDVDYLERFSQKLWDTWFVAPNLNRVTLLNSNKTEDDHHHAHLVEGDLRTGVVPAIFRSLSKNTNQDNAKDDDANTTVSLRLAVFPPKLQMALLEGLEDYKKNRQDESRNDDSYCKNLDIQFSPGNPTHTISVIQIHPGVVVNKKSKGDNDKALYCIGRLEAVPTARKQTLSEDSGDSTYKLQQQRTSVVPQQQKHSNDDDKNASSAHNSNLKVISNDDAISDDSSSSICRAYWKLQEAWERYQYEPPSLDGDGSDGDNDDDLMWALDCGAAPGGWTKFLFRPGLVDRIYAVDPGKLSPEVFPGLDAPTGSNTVRHVDTTIQKALPQLAIELKMKPSKKTNKFLDIWVSDMCVKDMSGQIDCFLQARTEGVVGPGTFFVLTLKCIVGYSSTAFDHQSREQVERLEGISRDVDVIHLFSNRSSERTVIGYLT